MHTWVCTVFKWNYEQHLYTHTLIPTINRFVSTNEPLSVFVFWIYWSKFFCIVQILLYWSKFFCILHFCHTCSLYRVELVVQFPTKGSTQVLCLFPIVLWLWHSLYSVGPHPVSGLHIYTFVVSWAFMVGAASQAGDADSSRAPGLTSGLQGSMNVHRGALLLVPQWQCISSSVFYITDWIRKFVIRFSQMISFFSSFKLLITSSKYPG